MLEAPRSEVYLIYQTEDPFTPLNLVRCFMKSRNDRGAIGLVASVALILVVIGIALFLLSMIIGGHRELSNAVDSGVLNVAKQSLVQPTIDVKALGTPEFSGLGENKSDQISLLNYNRAVAQVMMVALNAQDENTDLAYNRVKLLDLQLQKLGTALAEAINTGTSLNNAFDQLLTVNNTRMLGGLSSRERQIRCAFMKPEQSTNIWFSPESLPNVDINKYLNTTPGAQKSATGQPYLKGYSALKFKDVTLVGTPVFPATLPHLVSTAEFQSSLNLPELGVPKESIPANSFNGGASSEHISTKNFVGSVACAIVGCAKKDFVARIPMGYIKIVNKPGIGGSNVEYGAIVTDGDNDLFNKELFSPSSISESDNGVFTTDKPQIAAWVKYNNSSGDDEYGHDGSIRPDVLGYNIDLMHFGDGPGQRATMAELLNIKQQICSCNHLMYTGTLGGPCKNNAPKWRSNYRRTSKVGDYTIARPFMLVEDVKRQILVARSQPGERAQAIDIDKPKDPSGLMLFSHSATYPMPAAPLQFAKLGSPWQLMNQVGPCASTRAGLAFRDIYMKCQQIRPGTSEAEIIAALDSKKIPMGSSFYLYLDSKDKFVMDATGPAYKTAIEPDGIRAPETCQISYEINNLAVNTARGGVLPDGDVGFDDAPFSQCPNKPLGIDRAVWTASSGYQNLLGVLEFENDLSGSGQWCAPN